MKLQKTLAASAIAALVIAGFQTAPANAEISVTGDSSLEAAYDATTALARDSALEIVNSNSYMSTYVMFHQPTGSIPANVAMSMGAIQNLYAVGLAPDPTSTLQGFGFNDFSIESLIFESEQLIKPEMMGLVSGGVAPESLAMVGASSLTEYSIIKQDDTHYLIHFGAQNAQDPVNNPLYATLDSTVTLNGQYVTDIQNQLNLWSQPDQSDIQSETTSVTFITDQTQLDTDWTTAWNGWTSLHYDASVQPLVAKINTTFKLSTDYAKLKGLTAKDSTKGAKTWDTYSPSQQMGVLGALNDKNKVIGVGYTGSVRELDNLWVRIFGASGFGPKSINYNKKKRTYSLKGYSGDKVQLRLDKAGHIIGAIVKSDPNSDYAAKDYNSTFTYSTDKAFAKKWLSVDPNVRPLLAMISDLNAGGETRTKGKATFSLGQDGVTLNGDFTSSDGSGQDSFTLNLSSYPAGSLQKVLKMLGLKLS